MFGGALSTNFNPKQFSGLKLWLDAANPSNNGTRPADGTTLSTWVDVSGTGNNALIGGGTPTFKTGIKNSLPGIFYDGASCHAMNSSATLDLTSGATIFVVANETVGGENVVIIVKRDLTETFGWQLLLDDQTPPNTGVGYGSTNAPSAWSNTNWSSSQTYLWGWNTSSTNTSMYQNGASIYSNNGNFQPSNAVTAPTYIASYKNAGNFLTGYIHEILIYNSSLSTAEMALVNEYLRKKWALY